MAVLGVIVSVFVCYCTNAIKSTILVDNMTNWVERGCSLYGSFQDCLFGTCLQIKHLTTIKQQYSLQNYTNISIIYNINLINFDNINYNDIAYMLYKCDDNIINIGKTYKTNGIRLNETVTLSPNCDNNSNIKLYFSIWAQEHTYMYIDDLTILGTYKNTSINNHNKYETLLYESMCNVDDWVINGDTSIETCDINNIDCNCIDNTCVHISDNTALERDINVSGYGKILIHFAVFVYDLFEVYYKCDNEYVLFDYNDSIKGLIIVLFELPKKCNNVVDIRIMLIGNDAVFDSFYIFGIIIEDITTMKPVTTANINTITTTKAYAATTTSFNSITTTKAHINDVTTTNAYVNDITTTTVHAKTTPITTKADTTTIKPTAKATTTVITTHITITTNIIETQSMNVTQSVLVTKDKDTSFISFITNNWQIITVLTSSCCCIIMAMILFCTIIKTCCNSDDSDTDKANNIIHIPKQSHSNRHSSGNSSDLFYIGQMKPPPLNKRTVANFSSEGQPRMYNVNNINYNGGSNDQMSFENEYDDVSTVITNYKDSKSDIVSSNIHFDNEYQDRIVLELTPK